MSAYYSPPLATPMQRMVAYGCDALIMINTWLISLVAYGRDMQPAILAISFLGYHFLYYMGLTLAFGATPAKLALGLRIVSAEGAHAEPTAILVRYLVFSLTMSVPLGVVVSLGFLINDADRRAIHDRIARTLVFRQA